MQSFSKFYANLENSVAVSIRESALQQDIPRWKYNVSFPKGEDDLKSFIADFYVLWYVMGFWGDTWHEFQNTYPMSLINEDTYNKLTDMLQNAFATNIAIQREFLLESLFLSLTSESFHGFIFADYDDLDVVRKYGSNYRNLGRIRDVVLNQNRETLDRYDPKYNTRVRGSSRERQLIYSYFNEYNLDKASYVEFLIKFFKGSFWENQYGGDKWSLAAEAWLRLLDAPFRNDPKYQKSKLAMAVDHIYDLQHNTGFILNKSDHFKTHGMNMWIGEFLNIKATYPSQTIFSMTNLPRKLLELWFGVLGEGPVVRELYGSRKLPELTEEDKENITNVDMLKKVMHVYRLVPHYFPILTYISLWPYKDRDEVVAMVNRDEMQIQGKVKWKEFEDDLSGLVFNEWETFIIGYRMLMENDLINDPGETASWIMTYAVRQGEYDKVRELLEIGFPINSEKHAGSTYAHNLNWEVLHRTKDPMMFKLLTQYIENGVIDWEIHLENIIKKENTDPVFIEILLKRGFVTPDDVLMILDENPSYRYYDELQEILDKA